MSASYQSILWNRQKKIYDTVIVGGIGSYLILFIGLNLLFYPEITGETLIIRAFGTLALLLLHIILMIGPLARISPVFLPLLYNRRHLGVAMFCMASVHGIFSVVQFHALSNLNPILSVFLSNTHFESLTRFPFQTLGFAALVILSLMAITSHDFWLHNLSPRIWKTLHMGVYLAYALVVLHVVLGVIQYETDPLLVSVLATGFFVVSSLHLTTGSKERKLDQPQSENTTWVRVCHVADIPENRAKVIAIGKERIAVFKYNQRLSAISNVCKHQNGPLGEGRIIDGCITCPWHGYQYQPHNGSSPPPFKEKVATYDVKLEGEEVWVNSNPYPEGTERTPALIQ